MAENYLFEEYDPKKFENQLKGIDKLENNERQKILLDAMLNPTAYFLSPMLPDNKGFRLLRTKDGKPIFPIYTSVKKAMKDPSFDVSAKLFRGTIAHYGLLFEKNEELFGIMLNFSPDQSGIFISRESILQMNSVFTQRIEAIRKNSDNLDLHSVTYEIPPYTDQVICRQAAASVLKDYPTVSKCWIRRSSRKEGAEKKDYHLCYIVDAPELSDEDCQAMVAGLTSASKSILKTGEQVEVILQNSRLGTRLSTGATPIYEKQ